MVKIKTIQEIAKKKGLRFEYSEPDQAYVMFDSFSGQAMAIYADITIQLITSDKVWREECNKLKPQSKR